jgi:hypothetical protein
MVFLSWDQPTKPNPVMKRIYLLFIALFATLACQAQSSSSATLSSAGAANYTIHVQWLDNQGQSNSLEVLTTEGEFNLSTIQKNSVKINNTEIPITLSFKGELKAIDPEKGRLKLFLGRTVPYVTGTFANGIGAQSSSYSQLSVGLDSTFIVTFGKEVVIQSDENGQISILVNKSDN